MALLAARSAWRKSIVAVGASAADHLVQRILIDGHADLAFEAGDIFAEQVLREAAIEGIDGAFDFVGGHVEWRYHDIGDAEYDLLPGLPRFGPAYSVLGRAEDRVP